MNIYESINAIMQEVPAIAKEKQNAQQGFKYRGIDDVMNALQPLLAKYKVFVTPEVIDQQRQERTTGRGGNLLYSIVTVKYTFYAEDGSSVAAIVTGEGMDSGDKATNKAMAAAFKYALFQTFCIPTEEMKDADAETPEASAPAIKCSKCGGEVKGEKTRKGKWMQPAMIAEAARQKYGCVMCGDCMRKAKAESGANNE